MAFKLIIPLIAIILFFCLVKAEEFDERDPEIEHKQPKLTKQQIIALTRDYYARGDPDKLTYGFFPVWAFGLVIIAAAFFVVGVISGILYLLGCKSTRPETINRRKSVTSLPSASKIGVDKNQ